MIDKVWNSYEPLFAPVYYYNSLQRDLLVDQGYFLTISLTMLVICAINSSILSVAIAHVCYTRCFDGKIWPNIGDSCCHENSLPENFLSLFGTSQGVIDLRGHPYILRYLISWLCYNLLTTTTCICLFHKWNVEEVKKRFSTKVSEKKCQEQEFQKKKKCNWCNSISTKANLLKKSTI